MHWVWWFLPFTNDIPTTLDSSSMVELYSLVGGINLIVSNHMLVVTQHSTQRVLQLSGIAYMYFAVLGNWLFIPIILRFKGSALLIRRQQFFLHNCLWKYVFFESIFIWWCFYHLHNWKINLSYITISQSQKKGKGKFLPVCNHLLHQKKQSLLFKYLCKVSFRSENRPSAIIPAVPCFTALRAKERLRSSSVAVFRRRPTHSPQYWQPSEVRM